jgi:hypothetical protein
MGIMSEAVEEKPLNRQLIQEKVVIIGHGVLSVAQSLAAADKSPEAKEAMEILEGAIVRAMAKSAGC